jgi:hypothetical protein
LLILDPAGSLVSGSNFPTPSIQKYDSDSSRPEMDVAGWGSEEQIVKARDVRIASSFPPPNRQNDRIRLGWT